MESLGGEVVSVIPYERSQTDFKKQIHEMGGIDDDGLRKLVKEQVKNNLDNLKLLLPHDEVKFVILDKKDYEWSRDIIKKYKINETAHILLSPVFDKLELKEMVKWILEDRLPVRLQTQLHKIIWDKNTIGV